MRASLSASSQPKWSLNSWWLHSSGESHSSLFVSSSFSIASNAGYAGVSPPSLTAITMSPNSTGEPIG